MENHKLGERILYITVFDHKERTTRVYTQDDELETFYSTKSDAPLVDIGHFILEVEIDAKIDSKGDPVCSDSNNLDSLRKHHRSILEHIQYRLEAGDVTESYAIENSWTMKAEDTISTLHRLREGNDEAVLVKAREEERTEESLESCYFMHLSIERERRLLDERRGKWIARKMEWIAIETEWKLGMGVEYRVNKQTVERKPATNSPEKVKVMLGREQYYMELLLVYEVKEWEQLFWIKLKAFLVQISEYRMGEKERLTREWRANCWKRLNTQMHAALKRMADVDEFEGKDWFLKILGEQWALSIEELFEGVENSSLISLSTLRRGWIRDEGEEMRLRLENEIDDIEFRLKRGSDLGRFDQFWDDYLLFYCRYSWSKWIKFDSNSTVPLEIYSHALKRNKNIIHIAFCDMNSNFDVNPFLCDLSWVTSISPDRSCVYTRCPP